MSSKDLDKDGVDNIDNESENKNSKETIDMRKIFLVILLLY